VVLLPVTVSFEVENAHTHASNGSGGEDGLNENRGVRSAHASKQDVVLFPSGEVTLVARGTLQFGSLNSFEPFPTSVFFALGDF
jgi:hypothetical protein